MISSYPLGVGNHWWDTQFPCFVQRSFPLPSFSAKGGGGDPPADGPTPSSPSPALPSLPSDSPLQLAVLPNLLPCAAVYNLKIYCRHMHSFNGCPPPSVPARKHPHPPALLCCLACLSLSVCVLEGLRAAASHWGVPTPQNRVHLLRPPVCVQVQLGSLSALDFGRGLFCSCKTPESAGKTLAGCSYGGNWEPARL